MNEVKKSDADKSGPAPQNKNEKPEVEVNLLQKDLAHQKEENIKLRERLDLVKDEEKGKWAAELVAANQELIYQNTEKEKRAAELFIANKELVYQSEEKEKRAAELSIANKELIYQNTEKEKRAAELFIANKELVYQSEEKEKRAAELGIANKELLFQNEEKEKRAAELIIANAELVFQNEEKEKRAAELINANKELEFQNAEKGRRAAELEEKNKEVEAARNDIEKKTKQLEVSSKYKSEFLANMSHELRTPLNSLLILSKDLSENKKKNLDEEQVESAEIIYKSGHDLLILINEVLDLSKIEAGKMTINIEKIFLKRFTEDLILGFKHNVEQKGLKLNTSLDIELPEFIFSDAQRLKQILKNLISNAIKFTDKGSVSISLGRHSDKCIIISVSDTGIGIQESKQMAVFEAFQQADGTTSRKYGGTGLGLSISRELAKLLGAEITLKSRRNEGSTFSVILPIKLSNEGYENSFQTLEPDMPGTVEAHPKNNLKYLNFPTIEDDRGAIGASDKLVLIIEDDLMFAEILLKLAHKKGFKCLSAATGEDGFFLAKKHQPHAIILDMGLPGINGYELLCEFKSNAQTSHIPVHIISGKERSHESLKAGAIEYLMKPVDKKEMEQTFDRIEKFISRKIKNLLMVEDNENSRKAMRFLIGNDNVNYLEAGTGHEALSIYEQNEIDCIILDIGLPDMTGFDFIHKIDNLEGKSMPPIIIYTGIDLTEEQNNELKKYTKSIISKGVKSEILLLEETALFLHRMKINLPPSKTPVTDVPFVREKTFENTKVLLVDDDYRNVFALSKILVERGMKVIKAENGIKALEMLESHPGIDLVLMDIMMPEMDGYEATRGIRAQEKFVNLPVIAVTAKAMNYDKIKCINAGATGYITKPVEIESLLLMMGELLGIRMN
jgi:signal transduction histidine kinase/CheY-like chemotaxis protein